MNVTCDVSTGKQHATPAVSPADLLAQAKKNLGVRTTAEVAAACGLSKSTVERIAADPSSTILRNAVAFSTATGIPLDAITCAVRQPSLREAA